MHLAKTVLLFFLVLLSVQGKRYRRRDFDKGFDGSFDRHPPDFDRHRDRNHPSMLEKFLQTAKLSMGPEEYERIIQETNQLREQYDDHDIEVRRYVKDKLPLVRAARMDRMGHHPGDTTSPHTHNGPMYHQVRRLYIAAHEQLSAVAFASVEADFAAIKTRLDEARAHSIDGVPDEAVHPTALIRDLRKKLRELGVDFIKHAHRKPPVTPFDHPRRRKGTLRKDRPDAGRDPVNDRFRKGEAASFQRDRPPHSRREKNPDLAGIAERLRHQKGEDFGGRMRRRRGRSGEDELQEHEDDITREIEERIRLRREQSLRDAERPAEKPEMRAPSNV